MNLSPSMWTTLLVYRSLCYGIWKTEFKIFFSSLSKKIEPNDLCNFSEYIAVLCICLPLWSNQFGVFILIMKSFYLSWVLDLHEYKYL